MATIQEDHLRGCEHSWAPSGNGPRCTKCGTYQDGDDYEPPDSN